MLQQDMCVTRCYKDEETEKYLQGIVQLVLGMFFDHPSM